MMGLFSLILMPDEVKSAEAGKEVPAGKPEKQKVLFLTNSTFHAHGGCMVPFNGYCSEASVHFEASGSYKHLESTRKGKRISPYLAGQIKDQRILDLIIKRSSFTATTLRLPPRLLKDLHDGGLIAAMALPRALGRGTIAAITHENTIHPLADIVCPCPVR